MNFETIKQEDFSSLAEDVYIDPAVTDKWLDMMSHNDLVVFTARDDGKYIGRVNLWLPTATEETDPVIQKYFPGVPLIHALQIDEQYRKRGVAITLIDKLEVEACRRGFNKVGVGVEPDNVMAINLYEKLGYKFQMVGGKECFVTSWDETLPDGTVHKHEAVIRFIQKELSTNEN
jgi:ribosomal protein S18 acetylase RimI-like enzyme